jgi:hypothetical protein
MKRPLDIIPELVNAVYSTTTDSVVRHNGVLYVIREHIHDRSSLRSLVSLYQGNLVVHSIKPSFRQSYGNEPQYNILYTVIDPNRVASQVRLHISK